MIDWYLKAIRDNYSNFSGRARRSEYWYFLLCNLLIAMLLGLLVALLGTIGMVLYVFYGLAVLIPSLALVSRRLHDVGKSGWFYFIGLIPVIGSIWLLVLFCTEGNIGPNQYGEDPKRPYEDINEIGNKEAY